MHPKEIEIKDFNYELPDERVAKFPLPERDESNLLIYKDGHITTDIYRNLAHHIPPHSLLIFNNSKVVEARLLFKKETGAVIEVFCLEPHDQYSDITAAMLVKDKVWWKCLIGGASKWKHGMKLEKHFRRNNEELLLTANIIERLTDCFVVEFEWNDNALTFAEVLHHAGLIPLPPYLHRDPEEADKMTYQTVYAKQEGSVAAPTAGLHFTDRLFEDLSAKSIKKDFVTLHVGAGTFKPVKAEKLEEHEMHAEFIEVTAGNIQNILHHLDQPIIAVGTTSLRTIETLYWIGVKLERNPKLTGEELQIDQWDPYEENEQVISAKKSLENIVNWMSENNSSRIITKTQILVAPGYELKIAKALITNFHQPQSTLLLLIAALVGDNWKKIYEYALANDFRFLSYGDGSLLWNSTR